MGLPGRPGDTERHRGREPLEGQSRVGPDRQGKAEQRDRQLAVRHPSAPLGDNSFRESLARGSPAEAAPHAGLE